jgi:hypothetical protein
MKNVTVAVFNSFGEAGLLKERLIAAGIPADIRTQPTVEETLDFARLAAGVHVEVPRENFEAALGIVYDWNADTKEGTPLPSSGQDVPPRSPAPRQGDKLLPPT